MKAYLITPGIHSSKSVLFTLVLCLLDTSMNMTLLVLHRYNSLEYLLCLYEFFFVFFGETAPP